MALVWALLHIHTINTTVRTKEVRTVLHLRIRTLLIYSVCILLPNIQTQNKQPAPIEELILIVNLILPYSFTWNTVCNYQTLECLLALCEHICAVIARRRPPPSCPQMRDGKTGP